jgi:myo-inositol-1(or 4)-monophosphatase
MSDRTADLDLGLDLDLDKTLEAAVAVAREAGQLTLGAYRSPPTVRYKRTTVDLVTQTDVESEALIQRLLAERFPGHGLLGEEGSGAGSSARDGAAPLWIVDPVDGTTNFAHGHPCYCVSIALQLEGELAVGVVHAPVLGLTWAARRGGGATRNGAPIRVSSTPSLDLALCATGFPYDRATSTDNNLTEWGFMLRRVQGLRCCGSAAIDLAFVADGTYDAFWEKRLKPWDVAAGTLIVTEAGGRVTALDGGASVPPWPEVIVATNGAVHDELARLVRCPGS